MKEESLAQALETLVLSTAVEGQKIGLEIDSDPDRYDAMIDYPLSAALNTLGCPSWMRRVPFELLDGRSIVEFSVLLRCVLFETLGYIDPNLIFAAPGPGMAGFVVKGIGTDAQAHWFFERFSTALTWSFFALSEPEKGSDVGGITTTASPVSGGFRINGQKHMIGNGTNASIGIIFARTAPGPLGINAFVIEPHKVKGLTAHPLPLTGCRGGNLARLVLDDVFVPHDALLGPHLKTTERFSLSASATFDALRPCVGAIAVGIARGVLDKADSAGLLRRSADYLRLARARRHLEGLRRSLQSVCVHFDSGKRASRTAGLLKSVATNRAEAIVADVITRSEPAAFVSHFWLSKAWRDIKAFEYTDGTTHIHLLNSAMLFRGVPDGPRH
jgi:alkylation response protein AidB-like acyl-CoA dehydrogenase